MVPFTWAGLTGDPHGRLRKTNVISGTSMLLDAGPQDR